MYVQHTLETKAQSIDLHNAGVVSGISKELNISVLIGSCNIPLHNL